MRTRNLVRVGTVRRRNPVGAYVLHRMRAEFIGPDGAVPYGTGAELARKTGYSLQHCLRSLKAAASGATGGIGEEFARAMAENVWGTLYEDFAREARTWAARQPEPAPALSERPPPYWRLDPAWPEALRQALEERTRRGLKTPEAYFHQAGEAVVPDRAPTAEGVIRLAELLWMTDRTEDGQG